MKNKHSEKLAEKIISTDTKNLFGIIDPQHIRREISIKLTQHSYLPKAEDPRSDWVATVAYPAFKAIKQMKLSSFSVDRFATIGTGTGLDALAAIEVFGCKDVAITDLHHDVVETAAQNVIQNLQDHLMPVSLFARAGDLLTPLHQTHSGFDLIYENLPNIPLQSDGSMNHEQTSSSFFDFRHETIPGIVTKNLLTLHYLAILEAKRHLASRGIILSSIGARVPLGSILETAKIAGATGNILLYTWKIQSEPEDIIGGYAAWQDRGLGPFYFYPIDALSATFSNIDMVAAGDQAVAIEHALEPHRIDAITAYEAHRKGCKLGHTVAVLMSRFDGAPK